MAVLLPPPDFAAKFKVPTEPLATTHSWWRLASIHRPKLFEWDDRPGQTRFLGAAFPGEILYLAKDKITAFWEVFGPRLLPLVPQDRVLPPSALEERQWVEFKVSRKLNLFPAPRAAAVRAIGASNMSFAGDWPAAQAWAIALFEHPAAIDGILYRSDKNNSTCAALFRRDHRRVENAVKAEKRGLLSEDADFLQALRKRKFLVQGAGI